MRIETLMGVALIVLGAFLILAGLAPRLLESTPKLHPLIYTQLSIGELKIGTSPIAILLLTLVYFILHLRSYV